jgi:hypothetical protein
MAKHVTIHVTEADLEKADLWRRENGLFVGEGDSAHCAVSLAIARQIPGSHHIDTDLRTIRWTDKDGRHCYLTPEAVANYVTDFDAGEAIAPFKFRTRDEVPSLQRARVTPAAKARGNAMKKVARERQRLTAAEHVVADSKAPSDRVAQARQRIVDGPARIAEAEQQLEDLKAVQKESGEPVSAQRISQATRKAPKRVYRTKRRVYGGRVLRVNQAPGRIHYSDRSAG